jgi:hypothetical protein
MKAKVSATAKELPARHVTITGLSMTITSSEYTPVLVGGRRRINTIKL